MIARWLRIVLLVQCFVVVLVSALCAVRFDSQSGALFGALAGILLAFGAHPIIIAIDFAITQFYRSPLPDEQRISARDWLLMVLVEIGSSMRSFSWAHPFQSGRPAPQPLGPERELPMLCIHGYFCNRAIWGPFLLAAAKRGYRCDAITLEPIFGEIDGYAEQIDRALTQLLERSNAPSAILVAHSMGGLAARAWARRFGMNRAAAIVTLASPHIGTIMASLGHGGNVAQMKIGSPWLRELSRAETLHDRSKMICLYTRHDNIVAPQENATLEGAENIALAGLGHVRMIYEPRVWEAIFTNIELRGLGPERIAG